MAKGFAAPARMTILGAGADPILYQARALADRLKARLLVAEGQERTASSPRCRRSLRSPI
ncbi:MAG: hypothetical protein R3D61_15285 [Defluviimonas denitrificans]